METNKDELSIWMRNNTNTTNTSNIRQEFEIYVKKKTYFPSVVRNSYNELPPKIFTRGKHLKRESKRYRLILTLA